MTVDVSGLGLTLQCEDGTIRFQITSLYSHNINTKECVTMTSVRHSDDALGQVFDFYWPGFNYSGILLDCNKDCEKNFNPL